MKKLPTNQKIKIMIPINIWNLSLKSMKQEVDMKAIRWTTLEMEKESFSTKMEDITMASGRIIKCMAGENYSMKEES